MVSFLRTFTAKTSSAPFFSANITYNHGYQRALLDDVKYIVQNLESDKLYIFISVSKFCVAL